MSSRSGCRNGFWFLRWTAVIGSGFGVEEASAVQTSAVDDEPGLPPGSAADLRLVTGLQLHPAQARSRTPQIALGPSRLGRRFHNN